MELFARGIEAELRDIHSVSRAAAITGPRQAGKSTLARQLQLAGVVPNYFSLDDAATREESSRLKWCSARRCCRSSCC